MPPRVWAAIAPIPIQGRTRSARARDPFFQPVAQIGVKEPSCWKRYPSHIQQALAAKNSKIVRTTGGIGGQKRRKAWRGGKGGTRLRTKIPGGNGWARKEEVRKDEEGNWVYVD